jgi:fatty-acyl-CoA synthase
MQPCGDGRLQPAKPERGVSEMPRPSYVHGAGATPLIRATIGEYFDQIAKRYAEHDALTVRHQQVRWSWRELKQKVDDFAAGLLALGLERGERIGI